MFLYRSTVHFSVYTSLIGFCPFLNIGIKSLTVGVFHRDFRYILKFNSFFVLTFKYKIKFSTQSFIKMKRLSHESFL